MIDWVHQRGIDWSAWVVRRAGNGLGFPQQSTYTKLTGGIRGQPFMGETHAQALQFDDAVRTLQPAPRQLVHQEYLRPGTDRQKAAAIGVSRRTYYRLLDDVHQRLAVTLQPKNTSLPTWHTLPQNAANCAKVRR